MSILLKSILVGTGAFVASVFLILSSVPLFGDTLRVSMFINGFIGCFSIGSPVSYYCMKQTQKYKAALKREEELHKQLQDAHCQLKTRARIDMMTGLLNREAFLTELEDQKKQNLGQTSSFIFLDVDRFKRINDTWGHQVGDHALTSIARTILDLVGPETLAGRIGGEEFAIFLAGDGGLEGGAMAEAIRVAVEQIEFTVSPGVQETLSVSVGVTCAKNTVPTADSLKRADAMLYQAKTDGRNCVCVYTAVPATMERGPLPLILNRRIDPQRTC